LGTVINVIERLSLNVSNFFFFFYYYTIWTFVIHVVYISRSIETFWRELLARYYRQYDRRAIVLYSWSSSKQTRVLTIPIYCSVNVNPRSPSRSSAGEWNERVENGDNVLFRAHYADRGHHVNVRRTCPRPIFRRPRPSEKRPRRLRISSCGAASLRFKGQRDVIVDETLDTCVYTDVFYLFFLSTRKRIWKWKTTEHDKDDLNP